MKKNHLDTDEIIVPKDHLGFYLEHEISPVHQNISNLSNHLERRESLYRYLGLPKSYFSGKKILEVGPASGHNSLYIASCSPEKIDLLEPNPVAINEIHELYEQFNVPHTQPKVILQTLEEFEKDQAYDVVVCEAWLGISDHERKLMKKLAGFVKKEGVLITTLASPVGYFFNMIRRLFANQLLSEFDSLEKKSKTLLMAFSSHLKTLKDMTCPHIDWVQDSLLNPGFLTMHPMPEMFIEDIGSRFSIYNSYPNFSSDWRWYKSLYGKKKNFNEIFLDSFSRNGHNFLDYRHVFNARSSNLNGELEELCLGLRNLVTEYEKEKSNSYVSDIIEILNLVKNNLTGLEEPTIDKSIDEIMKLLRRDQFDAQSIKQMKFFNKCFGRELLYISAIPDY